MHVCATAQLTKQQQIQKLNFVYQQIRNNYVDDVSLEPLVEEAVIATLRELDPHSTYLNREQVAAMRNRISGEYAGIGIKYLLHNDTIVICQTIAHSPAERAKISRGDCIVRIDNRAISGLSQDSIATLLKGELDSKVSLDIIRRGEANPLNITLKRDNIDNSAISAAFRIGSVGYISVSSFPKPLATEFYAAYRELGNIEQLIIDLRDNGGGAISAAIDLTSLFLKKGDVMVTTEGRTDNFVYEKKTKTLIDLPLVVIINEESASASEIFAGAIQDHDRGLIIGRRSYGKGLVQKVIDLKDGTALCLTTARYKTPAGRIIQRPYSMGGQDSYYSDMSRYNHEDSEVHPDSLTFRTLNSGRVVYGGGGIIPDIYIPRDEPQAVEQYVIAAIEAGIVEQIIKQVYANGGLQRIIEEYETAQEFKDSFMLDSEVLLHLDTMLNDMNIPHVAIKQEEAMPQLLAYIKANIAQHIFGDVGYRYVYNTEYDSTLKQAFDYACDVELIDSILGGTKQQQ